MKNNLLLLTVILGLSTPLLATIHTVQVTDFQFSPNAVTLLAGDTIVWVWVNGAHTTTSNTIPTGATSWNSPINSTTTTYSYVPTVPGVYNYVCSFHASMGMTGSFTVNSKAAVQQLNATTLFNVFPNPASEAFHLQFNTPGLPVKVTLIDDRGNVVRRKEYTGMNETDLPIHAVADGNYTIIVEQGSLVERAQLLVHH